MFSPFRMRRMALSLFFAWALASACAEGESLDSPADGPAHGLLIRVQGVSAVEELELALEEQLPGTCDHLGQNCQWTALAPVLLPLQDDGQGTMKGSLSGLAEGTYRVQASASPAPGRTFATTEWSEFEVGKGPMPTLLVLLHETRTVVEEEEAPIPHFVSVLLDESSVGPSEPITFTVQAAGGEGLLRLSGRNETPLPQAGTNCPPGGCATGAFGTPPAPFDPTQGSVQIVWTAPADTGDYVHPLWLNLEDEAGHISKVQVEVEVTGPQAPFIAQLPPSFGTHGCFLSSENKVYCWGQGTSHQAGHGTGNVNAPSELTSFPAGVTPVQVAVSTNGNFSCVALQDGRAMCWGLRTSGRLGDGLTTPATSEPQFVQDQQTLTALGNVAEVVPGDQSACALLKGPDTGKVKCWGASGNGVLGDGSSSNRPRASWVRNPGNTDALSKVSKLYGGGGQFFAIMDDGSIMAWGHGQYGKLGLGNTTSISFPVAHPAFASGDVVSFALGNDHTCALMADRTAQCWGRNNSRQLGVGSTASYETTPGQVLDLPEIDGLSAGGAHTCAWTASGETMCWGSNSSYRLGDGTQTTRPSPVPTLRALGPPAVPLTGVSRAIAGGSHSCALMQDRSMECWGLNGSGQGGIGGTPFTIQSPMSVVLPW